MNFQLLFFPVNPMESSEDSAEEYKDKIPGKTFTKGGKFFHFHQDIDTAVTKQRSTATSNQHVDTFSIAAANRSRAP
jgi:hypothetical protein